MDDILLFRIGLLLWAVFSFAAACWIFTLNGGNVSRRIAIARSRWVGGIAGGAALALTVPQMQALLWSWLLPWYIPAIVVFLILSIIYLDYPGSRGVAGIVLIGAYYFLYYSFALQMPGALAGCIFFWVAALWAIAVSGKPCWMRDHVQWLSKHPVLRPVTAVVLAGAGVYCVYGSIVL